MLGALNLLLWNALVMIELFFSTYIGSSIRFFVFVGVRFSW